MQMINRSRRSEVREGLVKMLTFAVGSQAMAIDVRVVREILSSVPVTPVPRMARHLPGVISLRGRIVPVIDLRRSLGCEQESVGERPCLIVVEIQSVLEVPADCFWALRVDQVDEVTTVAADEIRPLPHPGDGQELGCIAGLVELRGVLRSVLDVEVLLRPEAEEGAISSAVLAVKNDRDQPIRRV